MTHTEPLYPGWRWHSDTEARCVLNACAYVSCTKSPHYGQFWVRLHVAGAVVDQIFADAYTFFDASLDGANRLAKVISGGDGAWPDIDNASINDTIKALDRHVGEMVAFTRTTWPKRLNASTE